MTGRANWISSPEGRPTDTIYANPFVADVNGTRTLFTGGSDGAHARARRSRPANESGAGSSASAA